MIAFMLLAAAQIAAPPAQAAPAPEVVEARQAEAQRLARLLNSQETIVGSADDDTRAVAVMGQLVEGNADLAALEKRYPGISKQIAVELMPLINRSANERLPQLWERQARLYADTFTAAELRTLNAFYGSSTGAKLIAAMMRNVQPRVSLEEAKRSPDFSISPQSALADIKAAVPAVVQSMDANDQAVLIAFATSGLAPKMKRLAPQTQQVVLTWMNESAPWEEAATEKLIERIVAERMKGKVASSGRKKSS